MEQTFFYIFVVWGIILSLCRNNLAHLLNQSSYHDCCMYGVCDYKRNGIPDCREISNRSNQDSFKIIKVHIQFS